jgi:hypothetical protein
MNTRPSPASRLLDAGITLYENKKFAALVISLCAMAIGSLALFLWATARHGIGMSSDSVEYLWAARNLAGGVGIGIVDAFGNLKPMVFFPPLYPIVVSPFYLAGINGMDGARGLGALSVGTIVILIGVVLYRLTNRSIWYAIIGVLVLLSMPPFWDLVLYAMTEPLYLVCTLAGLISLDQCFSDGRRRWLILAAVFFSLSFLDRYIGIAIVSAGLFALLFRKGLKASRKIQDLILMGAITILPLVIWLVPSILRGGTGNFHKAAFVPISFPEVLASLGVMGTWLNPVGLNKLGTIPLVVFAFTLPIARVIFMRPVAKPPSRTSLPLLLAAYAVFYAVFMAAARLWGGLWGSASPLSEPRYLFVFVIILFLLAVYGLFSLQQALRSISYTYAALLAGVSMALATGSILVNKVPTRPYIQPVLISRYNGLGLQKYWEDPNLGKLIDQLKQLPPGAAYFTDDVQRLYFYAGRPSSYIRDLTADDLNQIRRALMHQDVGVVFFENNPDRRQALERQIPQLDLFYEGSDGASIYFGRQAP